MTERTKISAKRPETKGGVSNSPTRESESAQPLNSPVAQMLFLQRTMGNRAVQRLINSGDIRETLGSGQRNDQVPAPEATNVVQQKPARTSTAVIQREEAAPAFNIATATWQQAVTEARRLAQTRRAADRATALSYYKQLIIRAAANVPVPAPLTARTPTEADIRWSWPSNVDWAARANPNLVDNHPDNYWQWLEFNPSVFNHSQTYAESVLAHELDHAAHGKALFNAWTAAGSRGSWDAYYQRHFGQWTEPAISVSSPGMVGALSGLPSRIQPSAIEFRAYVRQLTSYFHRLARTEHELLPKAVVLFYPLRTQNVPSETIRDPALDLAAAKQQLLQYFADPPVTDTTQKLYVRILLAQGFKSALLLFRPAADQPQMRQDFAPIMQFPTSTALLQRARQGYQPQP